MIFIIDIIEYSDEYITFITGRINKRPGKCAGDFTFNESGALGNPHNNGLYRSGLNLPSALKTMLGSIFLDDNEYHTELYTLCLHRLYIQDG